MRKICEWSNCKELATGEGLIKKDINKQYKWFCAEHLKIHNKINDNSCDWKRCKHPGEFKAPSKAPGEYKWFCSEHIKIYNHEWDFFSGMAQDKIEEFIYSDITWHKPTSKLGSKDNFFNKVWRNILEEHDISTFSADFFKQFENKTIYSSKEIEALKKLDLKTNVKWSEIREQFKKLVKKYHPDTNSGDKKFENKLKEITIAYTFLRNNQKNVNHGK
jgi:DnaJ domain